MEISRHEDLGLAVLLMGSHDIWASEGTKPCKIQRCNERNDYEVHGRYITTRYSGLVHCKGIAHDVTITLHAVQYICTCDCGSETNPGKRNFIWIIQLACGPFDILIFSQGSRHEAA